MRVALWVPLPEKTGTPFGVHDVRIRTRRSTNQCAARERLGRAH
jgi:hypothetical protein